MQRFVGYLRFRLKASRKVGEYLRLVNNTINRQRMIQIDRINVKRLESDGNTIWKRLGAKERANIIPLKECPECRKLCIKNVPN